MVGVCSGGTCKMLNGVQSLESGLGNLSSTQHKINVNVINVGIKYNIFDFVFSGIRGIP